jgi:membrane-bound lytic murein transglycosylase MltF
VKNSTSEAELRKFQRMVEIFKQYAGQYRFDHLMIIAQGYQESQLDQERRSMTGAIGVMQVLPKTARDPAVGIPDVTKLDNNVHAGVKYLRFMTDRYFDAPEVDAVNRMLFAFAAYNAGPLPRSRGFGSRRPARACTTSPTGSWRRSPRSTTQCSGPRRSRADHQFQTLVAPATRTGGRSSRPGAGDDPGGQ